jgi:hypothetical protein
MSGLDSEDGRMRRLTMLFALVAALAVPAGSAARPAVHLAPSTHPAVTDCQKGYYKNVDGRCVHSPSSDPSGATAKCRDGTYSYSLHASGTCSHHGGVARWIHHP